MKSFYIRPQNVFMAGLLPLVIRWLETNSIEYQVEDKRQKPENLSTGLVEIHEGMLKGITLHDYQVRTIKGFVEAGRGVVQLPTGSGKTEIAIAIVKALNVPTIWLTHRVNLLYQTAKRFVTRYPAVKDQIGVVGNGVFDPKFLTMATVQTIQSMLKNDRPETAAMLRGFQCFVIDEAHWVGSEQFSDPPLYCTNAYYRVGLTATPFMSENRHNHLSLMGITGPVVSRVTNFELIERGILAKPFFKYFTVEEPRLARSANWRTVYEQGIIYNRQRNLLIASQVRQLAEKGKKILVIVRERAHGRLLCDLLEGDGVKAKYQDGENTYVERTKALKWLSSRGDCIIATNIFDEGIDVSEINVLVLAAGTKAAPAFYQRTGRAMRKKSDGNYAIVIDFIDRQHHRLLEHSERRYKMAKQEKGFVIL